MEAETDPPNWQDLVDKDIVKRLKPKEVKRQEVINGKGKGQRMCFIGVLGELEVVGLSPRTKFHDLLKTNLILRKKHSQAVQD